MLLHIPKSFTPDLLHLLMALGHGEELLICDANYPYRSMGKAGENPVYITGISVAELLRDILQFFPLDQTVDAAVVVMESAKESDFYSCLSGLLADVLDPTALQTLPRYDFYERAKYAVGLIVTSDTVKGGNVLIKKGVVRDDEA